MNISFSYFFEQMLENPVLLIAVLLTLGVIFVNGWTDAPNAIATCVATRSMPAGAAIVMSAVFNFLGVLVMSMVNTTVAMTIKNMVNFNGDNNKALIALCAAMFAIVVWAVAAWYFGIPTSESHALIAGLSGAAIALQGGLSGINPAEWMKVVYGLGLSSVLGFAAGYGASRLFMHGAQDGQKFMDVFLRVYICNPADIKGEALFMVDLVISACEALKVALTEFPEFRKSAKLKEYLIRVNDLEEEGDELYINGMKALYEKESNAIEIIAWRDIYGYL